MLHELLIIGAGPAGISLAVEAIKAGVKSSDIVLLEKAKQHSYSIRKFYPESKPVTANYKGIEAQCDGELCLVDTTKEGAISLLDQAIDEHGIRVQYEETVSLMKHTEQGYFHVETEKDTYLSKACVIAIGIMGKPNKPSYPVPSDLSQNINYDITSKKITNSNVLVVGGGDSASEYAQFLVQQNNKVSFSYRREKISRMNEINEKTLKQLSDRGKVNLLLGTDIESVEKDNKQVKVNFKNRDPLSFDQIVYALGGSTPENFLKEIGIEFDGKWPRLVDGYETSIPGLYLVGDLSAGKRGGSIISAFNSSYHAMGKICRDYLDCANRKS